MPDFENVRELPVGKYDPERTLRYLLAMAEKGKIDRLMVVIVETSDDDAPGEDIWATWSETASCPCPLLIGAVETTRDGNYEHN